MLKFISKECVSVVFKDGETASWSASNPKFLSILQYAMDDNEQTLRSMIDPTTILTDKTAKIKDDKLVGKFTNINLNETKLGQFILLLKQKGIVDTEINRIRPFLENMFKNPFINAVEEIYDFCSKMDFEITEDGCFLAYKAVNKNLTSCHDNITQHKIGEYTEVEAFDTDRHQTCSKGLHFCSKGYLNHYKGDVIIIVKVNPMDVVAIPTDYDNMKGRCKRYMTVGILEDRSKRFEDMTEEEIKNNFNTNTIRSDSEEEYEDGNEWDDILHMLSKETYYRDQYFSENTIDEILTEEDKDVIIYGDLTMEEIISLINERYKEHISNEEYDHAKEVYEMWKASGYNFETVMNHYNLDRTELRNLLKKAKYGTSD